MNNFEGLLSLSEAARKWHLEESTLRKAISRGKLIEGIDAKKFGKQWIITEEAMKREYGMLETYDLVKIEQNQQKRLQIYYFLSQCLLEYCKRQKLDTKTATEDFSKYGIWEYLSACYDYLHLGPISEVISDITSRIKRGVPFETK